LLLAFTHITEQYKNAFFAFGIDANSHIGSVSSPSVGNVAPDRESPNGYLFRRLLESLSLLAVNTAHDIGHTWSSTRNYHHRIDFLCVCIKHLSCVVRCFIPSIDVSIADNEHHRVVAVELALSDQLRVDSSHAAAPVASPKLNFEPSSLDDPSNQAHFQQLISRFVPSEAAYRDAHKQNEEVASYIKQCASSVFAKGSQHPRKPWVSARSWSLIQCKSKRRRMQHALCRARKPFLVATVFFAWAAIIVAPYSPGSHPPHFGWGAMCKATRPAAAFFIICRFVAYVSHSICVVNRRLRSTVPDDKQLFMHDIAWQLKCKYNTGDTATSFKFVRLLGGCVPKPFKAFKKADGSITTFPSECYTVWRDHLVQLFRCRVVEHIEPLCNETQKYEPCDVSFTPPAVLNGIAKLNAKKGGRY